MIDERIAQLQEHRKVYVDYMRLKLEEEDWHGVSDCANDLRELDREIEVLERQG